MLARAGSGFGLLALADLFARAEEPRIMLPHHAPRAKRCIFLFMPGGPSQIDMFDPKPRVLAENGQPLPFEKPKLERTKTGALFGSPWKFSKYGQCGADVSAVCWRVSIGEASRVASFSFSFLLMTRLYYLPIPFL